MLFIIKRITLLITVIYCSVGITGCKKYLDAKQDQKLVVPETLQDLQSLLDKWTQINFSDPSAAEISADNYYLNSSDWNSLSEFERNTYIWANANLFKPGNSNAWAVIYGKVYIANVVLYNLDKIKRTTNDENDWNNLKGQALFLRSKSFLQIAFLWALAYDENTASSDLGIPLRLAPDFNTPSIRVSVKQTYDQIVQDLKAAISLLTTTPVHVLRSSKPAAYGMLARTYLAMRQYEKAGLYADSCLQLRNTLMDYNVPIPGFFTPSSTFPFRRFNPEVIYEEKMQYPSSLYYGSIDSALFNTYDDNDLRKTLFFKPQGAGPEAFEGDYDGSSGIFAGLATDEVYLMRAECYARTGNKDAAMDDLNTLMVNRWKNNGSWVPFSATDANDALSKILKERRKELVYRRLRWMDIKRLNKEGANITLKRILDGQTYTLAPNDLRYALPIPEDIITISGMKQNPR